jgi:hypothetical protein
MKDKIIIKKKSWKDISINDYYEITDVLEDNSLDAITKNIYLLSILTEIDAETLFNLSLDEVDVLMKQIGWITDFKWDKKWKANRVSINGKQYDVCVDLSKMTISQYIDFQNFWSKQDLREHYGNILACFFVPKGKKYCEGYDVKALAEEFRNTVSIELANAVCFFFLKRLLYSIKATQVYLTWQMRKMKRKHPEMTEKIAEMEKELARVRSSFGGWL